MSVMTAVTPVTVAVMAGDPIVGEGTVAYLRGCSGISPLPPESIDQADVVLVIAGRVSEGTMAKMERAAQRSPDTETRFVLVCDGIREPQLLRVLNCGLVSVLPRKDTDYEGIVRALRNMSEGRVELPRDANGWLAARIRTIQRDVLDPLGLTASGLYTREVDVLRLLADGHGTAEIAGRLNYSERTVKNIIQGLLTRMHLKNRSHAVAFALRNGLM